MLADQNYQITSRYVIHIIAINDFKNVLCHNSKIFNTDINGKVLKDVSPEWNIKLQFDLIETFYSNKASVVRKRVFLLKITKNVQLNMYLNLIIYQKLYVRNDLNFEFVVVIHLIVWLCYYRYCSGLLL